MTEILNPSLFQIRQSIKLQHHFLAEQTLLKMVEAVSEDKVNFTIEFNEFLRMMSKHAEEDLNMDSLIEAFK